MGQGKSIDERGQAELLVLGAHQRGVAQQRESGRFDARLEGVFYRGVRFVSKDVWVQLVLTAWGKRWKLLAHGGFALHGTHVHLLPCRRTFYALRSRRPCSCSCSSCGSAVTTSVPARSAGCLDFSGERLIVL